MEGFVPCLLVVACSSSKELKNSHQMSSYWSTAFDGTECIEYSLERMYVCMDIRIDNTNT